MLEYLVGHYQTVTTEWGWYVPSRVAKPVTQYYFCSFYHELKNGDLMFRFGNESGRIDNEVLCELPSSSSKVVALSRKMSPTTALLADGLQVWVMGSECGRQESWVEFLEPVVPEW
jgi:hypothetical protein